LDLVDLREVERGLVDLDLAGILYK
jgi:hypothetical protein